MSASAWASASSCCAMTLAALLGGLHGPALCLARLGDRAALDQCRGRLVHPRLVGPLARLFGILVERDLLGRHGIGDRSLGVDRRGGRRGRLRLQRRALLRRRGRGAALEGVVIVLDLPGLGSDGGVEFAAGLLRRFLGLGFGERILVRRALAADDLANSLAELDDGRVRQRLDLRDQSRARRGEPLGVGKRHRLLGAADLLPAGGSVACALALPTARRLTPAMRPIVALEGLVGGSGIWSLTGSLSAAGLPPPGSSAPRPASCCFAFSAAPSAVGGFVRSLAWRCGLGSRAARRRLGEIDRRGLARGARSGPARCPRAAPARLAVIARAGRPRIVGGLGLPLRPGRRLVGRLPVSKQLAAPLAPIRLCSAAAAVTVFCGALGRGVAAGGAGARSSGSFGPAPPYLPPGRIRRASACLRCSGRRLLRLVEVLGILRLCRITRIQLRGARSSDRRSGTARSNRRTPLCSTRQPSPLNQCPHPSRTQQPQAQALQPQSSAQLASS